MALTQVSTDGIKNGTITGSDLATNVDLVDNQKLRLGTGNDLKIFHDGTHSRIYNDTATSLNFTSADFTFNSANNSEQLARFTGNGSCEFYFNNSKKFQTVSNGAQVIGSLGVDELYMGDNEQIKIGAEDDFLIYHGGSENVLDGVLHKIELRHGSEKHLVANPDGSVELYYDNSKKFETHSAGVKVSDGNLYLDRDNAKVVLGATDDLQIYHDGSFNFIRSENGHPINFIKSTSENIAKFIPDGGVELYYDNVKHFETNSGGVKVNDSKYMAFGNHNDLQISHDGSNSLINVTGTGTLRIQEDGSNQWEFNGSNFKGNDERKVILGDSSDLQLYHSGHSVVQNTNSGAALLIASHETRIVNAAFTENIAIFSENGSVQLNHDDSEKFRTVSNGIHVTGHVRPPSTRDNTDDIGFSLFIKSRPKSASVIFSFSFSSEV